MSKRLPGQLAMWFLSFTVVVCCGVSASAQKAATITFTLDFPGSVPEHYRLSVDSTGHASYTSGGTGSGGSDSDQPFHYDFTISGSNRERMFDLAARARYFAGDINYAKHAVASTGTKTLSYKDEQRSTHATYNYTTNQPVQQLPTTCHPSPRIMNWLTSGCDQHHIALALRGS